MSPAYINPTHTFAMLPRDIVNLLVKYTPDVVRYVRASRAHWRVHGLDLQFWRALVTGHPVNQALLQAAEPLAARWPELVPWLPAVAARRVVWAAPLRTGELVVLDVDGRVSVDGLCLCREVSGEISLSPSTALLAVKFNSERGLGIFRMPSGEFLGHSVTGVEQADFMSDDDLVVYGGDFQLSILRVHDLTATATWRAPGRLDCIAASPTRCAGLQWHASPNLIHVWDHDGAHLFTLQQPTTFTILFAGGHLLTGPDTTNQAHAWHDTSGELVRTYTIPGEEIHGLQACGPRHFAATMYDNRQGVTMSVRIVDVHTGAIVKSRLCGFDDFGHLADARDDGAVHLVDVCRGVCVRVPTL